MLLWMALHLVTYELIISKIFNLLFLDCGWPWINETLKKAEPQIKGEERLLYWIIKERRTDKKRVERKRAIKEEAGNSREAPDP